MNKSIWHTADERPESHKDVVEKWQNCYDEICYSMWKQRPDGGSFDSHTIGWVYLSDLIALETELERTRKALDVALDWLGQVATPEKCDDDLCREFTKRKLAEIKTALEQKDVK